MTGTNSNFAMLSFIRTRGTGLAAVVAILAAIALLQTGVSFTITDGLLRKSADSQEYLSSAAGIVRVALIGLMLAFWLSQRKHGLFRCIILTNALFTFSLLVETYGLGLAVSGASPRVAGELLTDVVAVASMNILIFSIWYWIIDPPGVDQELDTDEPWHFLFPQRASSVPKYETWVPSYTDYLYVAYTASFAFSPTDVMPLSKPAKLLMMLQSTISLVTVTGLASSAIGILSS